jgi:hypothetical protein
VADRAQLWKQLGLQTSLIQRNLSECHPSGPLRRQFVLPLRDNHAPQFQDQSDLAEHPRSSSDISNLRAPDNVNTVQLVSVSISLRFRAAKPESSKTFSTTKSLCPILATTFLLEGKNQMHYGSRNIEERFHNIEPLFENAELGSWPGLINVDCPSRALSKKQKSKISKGSEAIIPLVDIAIRSLICSRPTRSPPTILPLDEDSLFSLANLAPAVFVPGYCDAVQTRAKLIPNIAKFLSRFLQHSEHKLDLAHDAEFVEAIETNNLADQHIVEQKDNMERDLWMTLTNGVKNIESARKLRPLQRACATHVQQSPHRIFDDLLNTRRPHKDDTASLLEDSFEDEHLDVEQDFADYEDEYLSDLYEEVLSIAETATVNVTNLTTAHFDDVFSGARSTPSSDPRTSVTMLDLGCSPSWPKHPISCEPETASWICSNARTNQILRTGVDSSGSQLNEVTQSCISTSQADVIGTKEPSHDYVSRRHPSYTLEDSDSSSSRAESLLLEQFVLHARDADFPISPLYRRPTSSETQDIIAIDDYDRTLPDSSDIDIEMPSYETSNRFSLTDIIGGDQLLWQMWTKRRPSMIQTDDDMLEMHAMYAEDPDMRLLETHTELDDKSDEYMLESESSNASSTNSVSSMSRQQDTMLPYDPAPRAERKQHHPFHLHQNASSASFQHSASSSTRSRRLSRGQSFIKRISGIRTSVEETSSPLKKFGHDGPRDVDVKRRKTLADYEKSSDNDDMLLR